MRTLRTKMSLNYTVLTAVFIIVITLINYQTYIVGLKKNMGNTLSDTTRQLVLNMDQYLNSLVKLSEQPLLDTKIQDILFSDPPYPAFQETHMIEKYLDESIVFPNNNVSGVYLVTKTGLTTSRFNRMNETYAHNITASPWFHTAEIAAGAFILTDSSFFTSSKNEKVSIFSVYRELNHTYTGKPYAMMVLDINIKTMDTILSTISSKNKMTVTVLGNGGNIVYSTNDQWIGKPPEPLDKKTWISSEMIQSHYGWRVMTSIPINSISDQSQWILNSTLTIAALSLIVAFLLSSWFSNRITKPLLRLQKLMKKAEDGQLHLRFHITSEDEISQLGASFNSMLSQIEELISKVYLAQIRQHEAEFAALQSQIKPHFLFNSLESIRMMAEIDKNSTVSLMISTLGKLLKETIRPKESTTYRQELSYISNYLYLQKFRLAQTMEAILDCEQSLLDYELPPLLIQPLVENAIQHGIQPMKSAGLLQIDISLQEENQIQIMVKDNGIGLTSHRLEEIKRSLNAEEASDKFGIGLWNVNQRIFLLFGLRNAMQIFSSPELGTTIFILLPKAQFTKKENHNGLS